ncbi:hypothetical protein D3C71_1908220 [compost metagenome]
MKYKLLGAIVMKKSPLGSKGRSNTSDVVRFKPHKALTLANVSQTESIPVWSNGLGSPLRMVLTENRG